MVDRVTSAVRSRMMAGIRDKNTRPELILRRGLHALGFRFRLNVKVMPGKPDLVFSRRKAVLFAHGCFWHRHDCPLFVWPGTREDWWRAKLNRNRDVDADAAAALAVAGWRVGIVWECAVKGRNRRPVESVIEASATWLRSDAPNFEIRGFE